MSRVFQVQATGRFEVEDFAKQVSNLGVPESPEILYTTALSKNPVGLYVPLFG
jgi:hypothetical protein